MGTTDLGTRIEYWRISSGRTRKQLADALDVSTTAVWTWEVAGTPPRNLGALIKALGVDMATFWAELPAGYQSPSSGAK